MKQNTEFSRYMARRAREAEKSKRNLDMLRMVARKSTTAASVLSA